MISRLLLVIFALMLCRLPTRAAETVELIMPKEVKLTFHAVFLRTHDARLTAARKFVMGDRQHTHWEERPTEVALGGSFRINGTDGRPDWCYYIGATEVTEAQWNAVMEIEGGSALPKTNVTKLEVDAFVQKLNQWLRTSNAVMPTNEGHRGYVRLPSEIEWEYAARGGHAVADDVFNANHPYASVPPYEWCFGVDDRPKPHNVATRKANPLGLYDMLGNVAEMTADTFHLEYYLGRSGGCVVRGGSAMDRPLEMRASRRQEFAPYQEDGTPTRSPLVGFRLAIGCDFMWGAEARKQLESELAQSDADSQSTGVRLPPSENRKSKADQRDHEMDDAAARIASIQRVIQSRLSDAQGNELSSQLGLLKTNLDDAQRILREKDRALASYFVRTANEALDGLWHDTQLLRNFESMAKKKTLPKTILDDRIAQTTKHLDNGWAKYQEEVKQLATLSNGDAAEAASDYMKRLLDAKVEHAEAYVRQVLADRDAYLLTKAFTLGRHEFVARFEKTLLMPIPRTSP